TGDGAAVLQRQVLRPAAAEHALHPGPAARPGARARAHRPAASGAPPLPRRVGELPPGHGRAPAAGRGARGRPARRAGAGRLAVLPARRQRAEPAPGRPPQRAGPAQPVGTAGALPPAGLSAAGTRARSPAPAGADPEWLPPSQCLPAARQAVAMACRTGPAGLVDRAPRLYWESLAVRE